MDIEANIEVDIEANIEVDIEVDITALDAMEELRTELADRGIVLALARVKQDLLDDLCAYGLEEKIGPDRLFPTLPSAIIAYDRGAFPPHPADQRRDDQ